MGASTSTVSIYFKLTFLKYRWLWLIWISRPESEKYYNFTELACQLNEPEDGVAPTDSRLRPDQRLMEEGKWEEANTEKVRIEEKQRAARRQREVLSEKAAGEGSNGRIEFQIKYFKWIHESLIEFYLYYRETNPAVWVSLVRPRQRSLHWERYSCLQKHVLGLQRQKRLVLLSRYFLISLYVQLLRESSKLPDSLIIGIKWEPRINTLMLLLVR